MSVNETLKKLEQTNLLSCSIKCGIISPIYLDYIKIKKSYDVLIKKGFSKMQAYSNLSEDFSVSETTIRKIIKLLQ